MAMWQARTGKITIGKGRDAVAWMQKVVKHINENYPECNYEVLTNLGGDLSQAHAITRFESLAQFEDYLAKLQADKQYQAIVQEMWDAELFTAWSDRLYHVRT